MRLSTTLLATWDRRICLTLNRVNQRRRLATLFAVVSRLGDGLIWYSLMLALPLLYGMDAGLLSLRMALTGLIGTGIYRWLKLGTRRPRPWEVERSFLHTTVEPLDRFSFPSGHTLHAVAFTCMVSAAYPELGAFLIPFTVLVALSRMVLGLHYPSDVAAGALIGAATATLSNLLAALTA